MHEIVDRDIRLQDNACRAADIAQFLIDDGIVAIIHPKPAILFRHRRTKQARFSAGQPEITINNAFAFPVIQLRDGDLLEKFANLATKQFMFGFEDGACLRVQHSQFLALMAPQPRRDTERRAEGDRSLGRAF